MDKNKQKAFIQRILKECEKEGLSIREVERLPQALKFAINDSVNRQVEKVNFSYQNPVLQESCDSDGSSHS